jgi:hypothetical protein
VQDGPRDDQEAINALIHAYVACKLALEALPLLPDSVRDAVRGPVTELCRIVEPELERLEAGSTTKG